MNFSTENFNSMIPIRGFQHRMPAASNAETGICCFARASFERIMSGRLTKIRLKNFLIKLKFLLCSAKTPHDLPVS